jgi:hypothetical protein
MMTTWEPSGRPDQTPKRRAKLPEDVQRQLDVITGDVTTTRRFGYFDMMIALAAGIAIGAGVLMLLPSRSEFSRHQPTADELAELKSRLAAFDRNSPLDSPKFNQCLQQQMRGQPNDMLQVVWPAFS